VIRTGFFTPPKGNGSKRSHVRFLSVALLTEGKGLHHLLKAAHLLDRRGIVDFELAIGGDGPEASRLKAMSAGLGLAERCRFLGMLTRAEVRNWMQWCDAFVLPSSYETFGVVIGEAMACGKPVIATRCGGPEFTVTPETGLLVDVADPDALADAMDALVSGQVRFEPRAIRQSVVSRFGEKAFLSNISAIYDQLWSEHSVSRSTL
jgi:glycosyltransferase involved in cell wall biosynthesis